MIKVESALRTVLKNIKILASQAVELTDSLERVLAEDIYADSDIPAFDNSAMDGYAVRSWDVRGASCDTHKIKEVIGDLKAGDVAKKILKNNQAMRIMTGAPIPKGADSVVMVEDTNRIKNKESVLWQRPQSMVGKAEPSRIENKEFVEIFKEVRPGENIRRAGEDIKKQSLVISKGTQLNSAHIGILASLGRSRVKVIRRPKVAILATGDEVVDVGDRLAPGKIRSSNTYTLYSQVLKCGGIVKNLGITRDHPRQLEKKIKEGLDCDLIITSGGVSVGDYDLVKDILAKMGTDIRFQQVAMRPGKPLVFGHIRGIPIFGLPGNPVSSMVSFEVFVRPVILKMLGEKYNARKEVEAVLQEDVKKRKGFRYFLRADTHWRQGAYVTKITGPQGSGILKSMVLANSLVVLPEEEEFVRKGAAVKVRFFD